LLIPNLFVFCGFLVLLHFILKYLSGFYSFDKPDHRKHHTRPITQIGGMTFASLFLVAYFINLIPPWLLIGGLFSLLLGALDDNFDVTWQLKLLAQLSLVIFLAYTFWDRFAQVSFYNYIFNVTQPVLLAIFIIWFVGIYNAVNLIDGLDGLASGFMLMLCLSAAFLGSGSFSQVNLLLAVLLLVFLVYNQRPAKVFMGDAGSLFLGFYVAVLPLLYQDLVAPTSSTLYITPFLILVFFLVADTTRVFFTRLFSGKSPMAADTIHLHHLVIQRSGSYLVTLFMIFLVTLISSLLAILSSLFDFNKTGMLIHLALLFLFVLTPPTPAYVNFITKLVAFAYTWHRESRLTQPQWPRTVLIAGLLFLLFGSLFLILDLNYILSWEFLFSFILFLLFIYLNLKDATLIPALQIFVTLLIIEFAWSAELNIFSQLFVVLLLIALVIFTVQRVSGTAINLYSTLDLLVLFITIGVLILSSVGIALNSWLFMSLFVIWFSLGFILRRTVDFATPDQLLDKNIIS